jgi:uncharacterized protein YbjQ (UPF0145 family)
MLVVTTDVIAGWEIQRVCGEVTGLSIRARGTFGASLNNLADPSAVTALVDARNEVIGRMLEAARGRGGNAVIGMRFDSTAIADGLTELCAYGTAVVAIPVTDAAKQTAMQLGYGQPGAPAQAAPRPTAAAPQPESQPGGSMFAKPDDEPEPADAPDEPPAASQPQPSQPQPFQPQPSQPQPQGYPQQPPSYPQPGYGRPPGYPQQPPPGYPPGYPQQPPGYPQQPPQGYPQG